MKKCSEDSSKRSCNSHSIENQQTMASQKGPTQILKGINDKKRRKRTKRVGGYISLSKRDGPNLNNDSDTESEEHTEISGKTLPPIVGMDRIHAALDQLTNFVGYTTSMTKVTYEKLIECKNTKINPKYINSPESVTDTSDKLRSMLIVLESNLRIVRKGLNEYIENWCNIVIDDFTIKVEMVDVDRENVEDSERFENGIPSDRSIVGLTLEGQHEAEVSTITFLVSNFSFIDSLLCYEESNP